MSARPAALALALAIASLAAPAGAGTVPDSLLLARRQDAATPPGTHPALEHGHLLLAGGYPGERDAIARFLHLAGGAGGRIVVVPSAGADANDVHEAERIAERMRQRFGVRTVRVLHARSRSEADSPVFTAPLGDATGVWVTGGDGARLVASYLGTRTERALLAVLARGAVVAGSGAGAAVWGSQVLVYAHPEGADPAAPRRADELVTGDPRATTFGWLRRTVVVPHFSRGDAEAALRRAVGDDPALLGIGLDDDAAVEVHGGVMRPIGHGTAYVVDAREPGMTPIELHDGGRFDLVRRVAF